MNLYTDHKNEREKMKKYICLILISLLVLTSVFTTSFDDTYFELIDDFVKLDVDFDSLGIQSHYDNVMPTISELSALYNKIGSRYNVPLKITEYSCNITDNVLEIVVD